jgi:hypothetical protein
VPIGDQGTDEEKPLEEVHLSGERLPKQADHMGTEFRRGPEVQKQNVEETKRAKAARRIYDEVLERARLAEAAQLASQARQDIVAREKQEALERERTQPRRTAMQRCEAATLQRTSAGAALTEAHVHEDEIRGRRLDAARKVARAEALFTEARRLRKEAENREQAAKCALESAAGVLDGVRTAAEQGRVATQDALTKLHVAQQEELEAQVSFLPFEDRLEAPLELEALLDLDGVALDDLSQSVDQERPPTPSKDPKLVDTEASLPSQDTVSDADRLAESIRKVEEMRQQEELNRQAKQAAAQEKAQKQEKERARAAAAAQLRLAQEERERVIQETKEREDRDRLAKEEEVRKRDERERLEREQVAQERAAELRRVQELQQQQQRINDWRKAHNRESQRCRARDQRFCNTLWAPSLALKRFQAVCDEFDTIIFSEQQPLVFENVPWPVLHRPDSLNVGTIDWSAVEAFFRQFRVQLPLLAYNDLVEKTHRRFHPDRWSSRGVLATVFDGDAREKIREAGNVVSQAITPIWRESKNP